MVKEKCGEVTALPWTLADINCRRQNSSQQGAKPDLSGCIFDAVGVKSAFALLSTKVTKPVPVGTKYDRQKEMERKV